MTREQMLKLGVFGAVVVAVIVFATLSGDTRAKQCFDTEFKHDEEARIDPKVRQYPHHAWFFEACRDGCDDENDANSCIITSRVYAKGEGLTYEGGVDLEAAARYAAKACELRGDSPCKSALRYTCQADTAACEARCEGGAGLDCVTLAEQARGDAARASRLFGLACDAGVADACAKGQQQLCSADPLECKKRCDAGDAAVCWQLGVALTRGLGLNKDEAKGLSYKRKACEADAKVDESCPRILTEAAL